MTRWAILTGEYPPRPGGVSDYTRLVAGGLAAAGDPVTVFAPGAGVPFASAAGVEAVGLPDRFGRRGRDEVDAAFARATPDRVLVQYVPHAYGRKAMNVPFVRWVAGRVARAAPVWTMFHEVAFPVRWWPPQHALLAAVTRRMAGTLARASERVFVSIPAWGELLRQIDPRATPVEWLPVPCTLETRADPAEVAAIRQRFAPNGGPLIGHFGTYGPLIADLLTPTLIGLMTAAPSITVQLIGRGSDTFARQWTVTRPKWVGRVVATGELPASAVATHLRACDVLVQPFPDGVSARRTSAMAALANGLPLVTNLGSLSEPFWANGAVAAAPIPDPQAMAAITVALLADARTALGARGVKLYRDTFALEHTIAKLRAGR